MTSRPPGSLKRVVVRGAGLAGAGHVLAQGLNLAAYLAIARLISPSEYGVYVAGSLVTGIALSLSSGGMQAAVIQRRDRVDEALATAVWSTVSTGLVLALAALATAPLVGMFFGDERAGTIAAALSGWLVLRCAGIVPNALMQRRFSFRRRLVVDPAGIAAFGAVSIVATAEGMGAWGLVLGTYASALVQLALSWGMAGWRPDLRLASFGMWRELAGFARHAFAAEFLRRVASELPGAVVGRSLGTEQLGQYRYGDRLGTQPQSAVTNVAAYVLLPAFARIATDAGRLRSAFLRALRWVAIIAVPTGFILLPLGEPLVVALLGEPWRDAGAVVMAFFAYTAGSSLVQVAIEAFKAVGRPDLLPRLRGLSAVVTAVGVVAGLPFGIAGVAAGVSIGTVVVGAYATVLARRTLGVPSASVAAVLWPPIAASIVMVAAVGVLDRLVVQAGSQDTALALALLLVEASFGALVYLAVLRLLLPGFGDELRRALQAVDRRRSRIRARHAVARTEGQ